MQGRLLLNIVIGKSAAVFELFSSEDQALLIWWNAFLIFKVEILAQLQTGCKSPVQHTLDLGFHVVDRVRRLHLKGDGLASD